MTNKEYYSRTEKSNDSWETPIHFFKLLEKEVSERFRREFTLDGCAR